MVEVNWTGVMALIAVALVAIGTWRLLLAILHGPDRSSEPPPLPDDPEEGRDYFPPGHRLIEQRHIGATTITLAERVRVVGVRAKGWQRVIFIHPPDVIDADDAPRIASALREWGSE